MVPKGGLGPMFIGAVTSVTTSRIGPIGPQMESRIVGGISMQWETTNGHE